MKIGESAVYLQQVPFETIAELKRRVVANLLIPHPRRPVIPLFHDLPLDNVFEAITLISEEREILNNSMLVPSVPTIYATVTGPIGMIPWQVSHPPTIIVGQSTCLTNQKYSQEAVSGHSPTAGETVSGDVTITVYLDRSKVVSLRDPERRLCLLRERGGSGDESSPRENDDGMLPMLRHWVEGECSLSLREQILELSFKPHQRLIPGGRYQAKVLPGELLYRENNTRRALWTHFNSFEWDFTVTGMQ